MIIRLEEGLAIVSATLVYRGQSLTVNNALLDTGSAGTVFATDMVSTIGLTYTPSDWVDSVRGIGGKEFVFIKTVERLTVGNLTQENMEIEIGAMDYGFGIEAVVGLDFLIASGAVIDLANLTISG